jgi:hypothetical protein
MWTSLLYGHHENHLIWMRTRAWWFLEQVLRLLASDNKDQPPCLIISRTFWSEWTQSRWSPLALCIVSLGCLVGCAKLFLATLISLLTIMAVKRTVYVHCASDAYCTPSDYSLLFSNQLWPIIIVIVHYHDTGYVFLVFCSHKQHHHSWSININITRCAPDSDLA